MIRLIESVALFYATILDVPHANLLTQPIKLQALKATSAFSDGEVQSPQGTGID